MAAEEFGSIGEIDRWVTGTAIEIASSGRGYPPQSVNALTRRGTSRPRPGTARPDRCRSSRSCLRVAGKPVSGRGRRGGQVPSVGERAWLRSRRRELRQRRPEGVDPPAPSLSYVKIGPELIGAVTESRGEPPDREQHRPSRSPGRAPGHRTGVEDLVTLDAIAELGIDEAQGYIFGPEEAVEECSARPSERSGAGAEDAAERSRTSTSRRTQAPEACASTSLATAAGLGRLA